MKIFVENSMLEAFTLAEVLITLGIIGIVAAMTIPALMNKIQDKQFKEAAKEAYSKASQVVQQMKQDNGGDLTYYTTTAASFKPVFMTYFKVIQDCSPTLCVAASGASTVYKSLYGDAADTWYVGYGQFITNDGMFWAIYNDGTSLFIMVDVNGYTKGPNVYGRDTFFFQLVNDKLLSMGANGTASSGLCDKTISSWIQGLSCMYNVMQGIDY